MVELIKIKLWQFVLFLFFLILAFSSYILCQAIVGNILTLAEINILKSNLLDSRSVSSLLIFLVSILIGIFNILLAESLLITNIFSGKFTNILKNQTLKIIAIFGIFCISVFFAFLIYKALELQGDDLSQLLESLGDGNQSIEGVASPLGAYELEYFSIIFGALYPFLLLSLPLCVHYFFQIFRAPEPIVYKLKHKYFYLVGIVSLIFVVPFFIKSVFFTYRISEYSLTALTGRSSVILDYETSVVSGVLYTLLLALLSIIVLHRIVDHIKHGVSKKEKVITFCVSAVYLVFLVESNLLVRSREKLFNDELELNAKLRGMSAEHLLESTVLDNILNFLAANVLFFGLFVAGYLTIVIKSTIFGKYQNNTT